MKKILAIIFGAIIAASIFASSAQAATLSDKQKQYITENCSSLKIQLQQLQRADARSRVHLGAQYETITTNLMLNLNLRLVKSNLADADIAAQQTTFASERTRFKNDYIGYSQALDKLISINCVEDPQAFYDQLAVTQKKRNDVDRSVERMSDILKKHRKSVESLKEKIKK